MCSDHGMLSSQEGAYNCVACDKYFHSSRELAFHTSSWHSANPSPSIHCNHCTSVFNDMLLLNIHIRECHREPSVMLQSSCNVEEIADSAEVTSVDFQDISDIAQIDGNDSLDSSDSVQVDRNETLVISSSEKRNNTVYNYEVNKDLQAKRLATNAAKPPIAIEAKDTREIDGYVCDMNLNVICNAGVYMTAIKPVLENITEGWRSIIGNFTMTCSNVSERTDKTKSLHVCTQATFHLKQVDMESPLTKVVMHFYHTDSKIQIQGGYLPSSGTSAASWLVKNLIEPLTLAHIDTNKDNISAINEAILERSSFLCGDCKLPVNPAAKSAKDRSISCQMCRKVFHKKCTDRREQRGSNWQRHPWYCNSCTVASYQSSSSQETPQLASITNVGHMASHHEPQQSIEIPGSLVAEPAASIPAHTNQSSIAHTNQPSIDYFNHPTSPLDPEAATSAPNNAGQKGKRIKFPNNSIRQRSSNILSIDPEKEFLTASLDSCQSTIVQQETEIKRLKETLDIRNKKILQLQEQVGHAAEMVGD